MGITIYKDFPNNQAFISTKILKDMVIKVEKKILIVVGTILFKYLVV